MFLCGNAGPCAEAPGSWGSSKGPARRADHFEVAFGVWCAGVGTDSEGREAGVW